MGNKLKIALMAGGNSSEYEVSIGSAAQVLEVLDRQKYEPYLVLVQGKRWFHQTADGREYDLDKNDFSLTVDGNRIQLQYALLMIHGTPGEDGLLQAYLEMMDIPFSSSSFTASAVSFDKSFCKQVLADTGISLAKEMIIDKGQPINTATIVSELGLPLFVKPNASGSSCGVSKVKTEETLLPAIQTALKEGDRVIIEEFLSGTEVDCGIVFLEGRPVVFPPTEIVPKKEFFDYEAKYTPGMSEEITPARITEEETRKVRQACINIYRKLGCKGVIRVDFMIVKGTPYLIEVNTVPGMSEGSIVPKEVKEMGWSLGELMDKLIEETRKQS